MLPVNASTTSSSFILNSQTEPPSNQSYHGNCAPIRQEEEKIGGLKPSCPFSSEKLPAFPVHLKLLTSANTPQRSDDSALSDYRAELIYEPGTGSYRYSSFQASASNAKSIQSRKQNGVFSNDFLTLGLPTLPSTWPTTKSNQPFASVAFANCEPPDNETKLSGSCAKFKISKGTEMGESVRELRILQLPPYGKEAF